MIDINIYMLAETKACPSCLFVQESAMCSSFQCTYWHLFCTGCWYCTAEAAKPHFSPSSFSLALFQIDTQFFALLTTPANWGQQFHSPNPCLLQPLSSLEMSSLHKAPCCAVPWSACVFRALLPWDREQGLLAVAGPCWELDTALWSCMCWAMWALWKTTLLSDLCKGICLGWLTATAVFFSSWKLLQHKSMFEALELNVL